MKPGRAELEAARGRTVPDLIAPGLSVLLCGINPSLYSAAVGHHFARPGNRFWPALQASGFTSRLLRPEEEGELLAQGLGITNVVARATANADELAREELQEGGRTLAEKVKRYQPRVLAVLGMGAFRIVFERPRAQVGLQPMIFEGARVWALPNPSGLNAHFQLADLARAFAELREYLRTLPD